MVFPEVQSDGGRTSRHKLRDRKLINCKEKVFSVMAVKQDNRMPRELVKSPFLDVHKAQAQTALINLI